MILFDSNVLIDYLNGNTIVVKKLQEIRRSEQILCISTITVTEVLSLSSLTPADIKVIDAFLSEFMVLSVTNDIARQAAVLRRANNLSVPDALIVSTALLHGLSLMTADIKLHKIPRLKLQY